MRQVTVKALNVFRKAATKQRLIMLLCLPCIMPHASIADEYREVVTSFGTSFSQVDSKIISIHPLKCYDKLELPGNLAKANEAQGEIISDYRTGNYRVAITRYKENWYRIWGQNIYIATEQCLINAIEQEVLLSLNNGCEEGCGSLHFKREGCKIIGLYQSIL